jgi:hypothetical protein
VDYNTANVVGVRFEGGDLLGRIVVVDAKLEVIATANDPIFAGDEAAGADGDVCEFEGFDDLLWHVSGVGMREGGMNLCFV